MKKLSWYQIFLILQIVINNLTTTSYASLPICKPSNTPFCISSANGVTACNDLNDNKNLWISVTLVQDLLYLNNDAGTPNGATYILANNNKDIPYPGIEVPAMTTYLNNVSNVDIKQGPGPNWIDGIIFNIFKDSFNDVWIAAYDTKNHGFPLVMTKLPGAQWPVAYIKKSRLFNHETYPGRFDWGGSSVHKPGSDGQAGRIPDCSGIVNNQNYGPLLSSVYATYAHGKQIDIGLVPDINFTNTAGSPCISPVVPYSIGIGQNAKQLWLTVTIKGTLYVLARNVNNNSVPSSPILNQKLYNTLNSLSVTDWQNGVFFSFIGRNNKVSLYVQNAAGQKLGEAVIPNVTSLQELRTDNNTEIVYGGSYIQNSIGTDPDHTICFTAKNCSNAYVMIPCIVNDVSFIPHFVSTVQSSVLKTPSISDLTVTVNGTPYNLTSKSFKPYGSNGGSQGVDLQTFLSSLNTVDLDSGVYFNCIEGNNAVFLNVQVGNGNGSISSQPYYKSQTYLLPGITSIQGNISFQGTSLQSNVNIFRYQTLGLTTSNSTIGPIYVFPTPYTINVPAGQTLSQLWYVANFDKGGFSDIGFAGSFLQSINKALSQNNPVSLHIRTNIDPKNNKYHFTASLRQNGNFITGIDQPMVDQHKGNPIDSLGTLVGQNINSMYFNYNLSGSPAQQRLNITSGFNDLWINIVQASS